MSIYEEILGFSRDRPEWQQDALRRIITVSSPPSDSDLDELETMLKADHGLVEEGEAASPEPLAEEHLPTSGETLERTRLVALEQLENVNRLRSDQSLKFALDGLTLVFGYNGSGKTGYCRVLKRMCRVRTGGISGDILSDVFDEEQGPPKATVRYRVGEGETEEFGWEEGVEPPDELSTISVFDARTVPVYANEQNRLEFLPRGLDVLPGLVDVCEALRERLDAQMQETRQSFEAVDLPISDESEVGSLFWRISLEEDIDLPSAEELRDVAGWEDEDEERLEKLRVESARKPSAVAERCETKAERLANLREEYADARSALSDEATAEIKELVESLKAARRAVKTAAEEAFEDEPLSGIGSEPWKKLFQYAREYSTQFAYPEEEFPFTGEDSRCVLCQQPLGDEAADRLESFEDFVQNRAQQEQEEKEEAVQRRREALRDLLPRKKSDIEELVDNIDELIDDKADVSERLPAAYEALKERREAAVGLLAEDGSEEPKDEWPKLPNLESSDLESLEEQLNQEAKTKRQAASGDEEEPTLADRIREHEDRKALTEDLEKVLEQLDRARRYRRLDQCYDACGTMAISRRNTKLRREHLTGELQGSLEAELARLDLAEFPLKVQDRTDKGASEIGVRLETVQPIENRQVLSDGEFQALGLAGFFAEMETLTGQKGMILDDPVSSFDHLNISRIAGRVIEEVQKGRQVVVFTHNVVFYHELYAKAEEEDVPVTRHCMRREEDEEFGIIDDGREPWELQRVKHRLHTLEHEDLPEIRDIEDRESDEYRKAIGGFYDDLRRTWERLVEEVIFGETVKRYRKSVETRRLREVAFTDDDYRKVYRGMKKSSEYAGHDRAGPEEMPYPEPDELQKDVQRLRDYFDDLKSRRSKLRSERKALEGPAQGLTE